MTPPSRWQFRLSHFFLLMTVVAALAGGAGGLLGLGEGARPPKVVFLALLAAAPLALSLVLGLYRALVLHRHRNPDDPPSSD